MDASLFSYVLAAESSLRNSFKWVQQPKLTKQTEALNATHWVLVSTRLNHIVSKISKLLRSEIIKPVFLKRRIRLLMLKRASARSDRDALNAAHACVAWPTSRLRTWPAGACRVARASWGRAWLAAIATRRMLHTLVQSFESFRIQYLSSWWRESGHNTFPNKVPEKFNQTNDFFNALHQFVANKMFPSRSNTHESYLPLTTSMEIKIRTEVSFNKKISSLRWIIKRK